MSTRREFKPAAYACPVRGCKKLCKSPWGLKQHQDATHALLPQQSAAAAGASSNDDYVPDDHRPSPTPSPPPSPRNSPPPEATTPLNRRGTTKNYHSVLDGKLIFISSSR
ncbi:hypothetical protein B0H17DRAFT_1069769 [Mycena rosella]|uniref:C2H2-type domain-containing protein n=1 Tax=Mycena rosella TaxID=1033263 RepID=A0AAD7DBV3_MYCRO|nr:hypothetical protein B0H17DRAFT_1069769 [Mycena rosella]